MGQVISLEDRIIKRDAQNPFSSNYQFDFQIPSTILNALEFIGAYTNNTGNEKYIYPIGVMSEFIFETYNKDKLHHLKENLKITWADYVDYNKNPILLYDTTLKLIKPDIINLLLNEFKLSMQESFNYIYASYIQLFINDYNCEHNEFYRIIFSDKKNARKNAMARGDGEFINFLNNVKYIYGFESESVLTK